MINADDPLLQADMERSRNVENKGRRAAVYSKYETTGQGVVEFPARLTFGLTYVEEPFIAYGSGIDLDTVREALSLATDVMPTALPLATGFVTEWDQDSRGHYVGAWVAVSVFFPPTIPVDAAIKMQHFFTFDAVAIKNVPFGGTS